MSAGGVAVTGPPGVHRRLNLHLRTASRVVLRLGEFNASDLQTLGKELRRISLERYWDGKKPVRLGISAQQSALKSSRQILPVASAAWRLPLKASGDPPNGSNLLLQLRLDRDLCTVSVDTSGELLHRRGYRQETSIAPARETLAAAMLWWAGYRGDEPLVDPMCGAGTILIEGSWIALRRAPGSRRRFAFEDWPSFDGTAWRDELERARGAELSRPLERIVGFDIHAGSLGVARRNARRAGAVDHLRLERSDIRALPARQEPGPGLVAANLPYGKRVGEPSKLKDLYRDLAGLLRARFPGSRAVLLVPESKLGESIGIDVQQRLPVRNGGLRCQFLLGTIGT